jgi:hypothetical protein
MTINTSVKQDRIWSKIGFRASIAQDVSNAGKADGAENVIRVKATVKNFREETNMSVITESGSFYTFNVKYAEEPLLLNIEMKDFIHDGSEVNRPNNALDIYLKELGSESPKLVYLISKSVHKDNKRQHQAIVSAMSISQLRQWYGLL